MKSARGRHAAMVGTLAALAVVVVITIVIGVTGGGGDSSSPAAVRVSARQLLAGTGPLVVFRSVDRSHPATFGRLAVAPLDGTTPGAAALAGPTCDRAGFVAGHGLCLSVEGTEMGVDILDGRLRTLHHLDLPGVPSRARVSPDGRWGGVTAFLVGHAYAKPGEFSSAATIIDMRSGRVLGDLEHDFTVTDHGKTVRDPERNYWGLTFAADDDTFYATLGIEGRTWLVKGSIRARRAHTIHTNVECPSLSPDQQRIGFKRAISHNPTVWRFTVLDLRTGRETPLAETRSVDDQLAWVDDAHLAYGDGHQTWIVAADGSGKPQPWIPAGDSATVIRG